MAKWAILAGCALAFGAAPAFAQDSAGVVITHGIDGDMAQGMLAQMGAAKRERENCWKLGCLLIVNETAGYDLVGFYVDTAKPGADPRWSGNQIGIALPPKKITLRYKNGPPSACNMPVRLVLRAHGGKDQFEVLGNTSLCTTPHQDTLLRLQDGGQPTVTLEKD